MFKINTARGKTVCFTGHRPPKLHRTDPAFRAALSVAIDRAIADGFEAFIGGMALGADTAFAELVLEYRQAGAPIRFIAAVPCADQDARWRAADRDRYRRLLQQADTVVTICERYEPYCMNARNRYMIENSGRLIAAWDGSPGGTAKTVELAEQYGREIIRLSW